VIDDPWFYALAIPAVVLQGLGKGGFSNLGALSLPLMALAISPVQAAAILLPLLMAQDVVSVWAFRRTWDRRIIAVMIPGAVIGIALGYLVAAEVSVEAVLAGVGLISILFALQRLWVERGHAVQVGAGSPAWVGVLLGIASGFTSQIAHAGSPPFQMWVLPKRLPRDLLVGTTSVFFATVNWIKVPAYVALGQFTAANMIVSAALLPVAMLSTLAGVWLVRRVPQERFYKYIYLLMILIGLRLLWDALN
jgi:uncharacterized membrane protein YfcA